MTPESDPVQKDTTPTQTRRDDHKPSDGPIAAKPQAPEATDPTDRLVPVTEAIRYRKRAQSAEGQIDQIKGALQDAKAELTQARRTIDGLERRQRIDQMLAESDTVDIEVARLLTEVAVEMMEEPDVRAAIDDLRRQKPYLFRRRESQTSAMTARPKKGGSHPADDAAAHAATTGDRRDLLAYLRLRRRV